MLEDKLVREPGSSLLQINVILEKEDDDHPMSIAVRVSQNSEKQIFLHLIIQQLLCERFDDFYDSSISYYHELKKHYVFGFMLGKNIASKELSCEKYLRRIPEAALNTDSNTVACCKLRIRKRVRSRLELLKDEQRRYEEQELGTKQKEKTIGEVVEKVALWRKMYAGFKDEKDEVVRMDLETAAKEIGIVKKTLDDYLLQIRNGKRFGFNFQKRFQEKIGQLRSYVRDCKEKSLPNSKKS